MSPFVPTILLAYCRVLCFHFGGSPNMCTQHASFLRCTLMIFWRIAAVRLRPACGLLYSFIMCTNNSSDSPSSCSKWDKCFSMWIRLHVLSLLYFNSDSFFMDTLLKNAATIKNTPAILGYDACLYVYSQGVFVYRSFVISIHFIDLIFATYSFHFINCWSELSCVLRKITYICAV